MENIEGLRKLMKLKEVERGGVVGERPESAAEHTYACMILAQHFLKRIDEHLDELKVMKLLVYHDLVEIEAGDIFILDKEKRKDKAARELAAFEQLKGKLPANLVEDYEKYFHEYEGLESREAMFVKCIDHLEPMIHWLDYKSMWRENGFSEEVLRKYKEWYIEEFPLLHKFFNELIEYLKANDYID